MSLYPNIRDSESEVEVIKFIDELTQKIDPRNTELSQLLEEIRQEPNSTELLQEMILKLARQANNEQLTMRLAAYLKSHIELLEAITHNVELASLFLVGENGQQTFTSVHRSILSEQAGRTRYFLASNNIDESSIQTNLADYRLFTSSVGDIGTKLAALDDIVEQSIHSNDIKALRNAYQEIVALFSGCMVFNDILIQNKALSNEPLEISKEFPSAPQDVKGFVQWIKDQVKQKECSLQTIRSLENERNRLEAALKDAQNKIFIQNKESKSLKRQVAENISIIQEQKDDLMQKIKDLQVKVTESHVSHEEN